MKVKRVRKTDKKEDVYDLEVKRHHNFLVNGGYVVHNSIDMTRYAMERVWRRKGK